MYLDEMKLPPGSRAEAVKLGGGNGSLTVYQVPGPFSEGPNRRRDTAKNMYIIYMYQYYVFWWYEGIGEVRVSHGDLETHDKEPWWTFNCDMPWSETSLVKSAQAWAHAHEAQFAPKTNFPKKK